MSWRRVLLGALGIVLLHTAPAGGQQPVAFLAPRAFTTAGTPADMAVVDCNGDGHLDVVVTNYTSASISVLLGTGTGDFIDLDPLPSAATPTQVVVGHFDADPHLDLAISETEADSITVMPGDGSGGFGPPHTQPSGHDSQGLAHADMNGDGHADLVVTFSSEAGGSVAIMLGAGDGTFAYDPDRERNLSAGSFAARVADFNGDGQLDVAATTLDGHVALLRGDGDGRLGRAQLFPTGAAPYGMDVVDLNGDGIPDVLTADGDGSSVSVLFGDGAGALSPPTSYPVGLAPAKVVTADLDGDGILDAVTANSGSGDVSWLRGAPGGTFGAARQFAAPLRPYAVVVADVDEDGIPDVLAAVQGTTDGAMLLMRGRRPGGLEAVESILPGTMNQGIATGDLDGDGLPDLVAASRSLGIVVVAANPAGGFAPPRTLSSRTDGGALALADLDRDGRLDVVALSRDQPDALVLLAQPDGSYRLATYEVAGQATGLVVDDLDGDGVIDIAEVTQRPPAVSVLFGQGDGTFAPRVVVELGGSPGGLTSGRFTQRRGADLAVGDTTRTGVSLLLARADRTVEIRPVLPEAGPGLVLAAADLDGDGFDDLALGRGRGEVTTYFGNGAGAFATGPIVTMGTLVAALAGRDVTGDGIADLVAADLTANAMVVAASTGDRSFGGRVRFDVGLRPAALAAADFDADGAYDAVTAGSTTSVLTNARPGPARSDANGDGQLGAADLIVLARALAVGPHWRAEAFAGTVPAATTGIDADGDGIVRSSDLALTLRRLFGSEPAAGAPL